MRAKLSVIIPVLNAEDDLPLSLPSLWEGMERGLIRELILSDGGSNDGTQDIADAAGAIWVAGSPSRGGQLRRGAAASSGKWLLFLHADTILPSGWAKCAERQMATGRPAAFHLQFDCGGPAARFVSGWANLRSRLFSLPYGDQGLLVSRSEYEAVGGYSTIPIMEDVAMSKALGERLSLMPLAVTTSAKKYVHEGWFVRGARNILILGRYLCGANPEKLAEKYTAKR